MLTIQIKTSTGKKFSIEADEELTVEQFKGLLEKECEIPAAQQRLIYAGHVLKDGNTLGACAIKDGNTVHLVRGVARQSGSSSQSTAPPTQPQTPSTTQPPAPQTQAQNPMGGLFGNLGGMGMNMGGMGGPNMAEMQRQLMENPEMMQQIMNSPIMENLMSNPEVLRTMFENDPRMRQLMEQNPELSHALNDPQILRQTMDAMRNPAAMQEFMRNSDRMMNNIESHPQGQHMLHQMYHRVQEPLMDAMTNNDTQAQTDANQPTTTPDQPTSEAMPNPWNPTPTTQPQGTTPSTQPTTTPTNPTNPMGGNLMGNLGALGGGLGGMPGMPNLNPQQIAEMMNNPMVQQMMQQMAGNPEMMNQMLQSNPMFQQMLQSNPQLRDMMTPEVMQQSAQMMANPEVMQNVLQMQQAMQNLQRLGGTGGGLPGFMPPMPGTTPSSTTPSTQPGQTQPAQGQTQPQGTTQPQAMPDFASMMNMFGGGGMMPGMGMGMQQPQQPAAEPRVLYQTQLQQLADMGFTDEEKNIRHLQATGGNVQATLDRLLME